MAILGWKVTPSMAVDDLKGAGLPSHVTANYNTGKDTLTYAVEACVSNGVTHLTDANAEKAMMR